MVPAERIAIFRSDSDRNVGLPDQRACSRTQARYCSIARHRSTSTLCARALVKGWATDDERQSKMKGGDRFDGPSKTITDAHFLLFSGITWNRMPNVSNS